MPCILLDMRFQGKFDGPADFFASLYSKIEVRTTAGPPFTIDLTSPPDPKTRKWLEELKPGLIFRGNAGELRIAPYGMPTGVEYKDRLTRYGTYAAIGIGGLFLIYAWLK